MKLGEGLFYGDLSLHPASLEVSVAGTAVRLTRTEYAILKLLLQNPRQVLAKSVILERIALDTPDCTDATPPALGFPLPSRWWRAWAAASAPITGTACCLSE